MKQTILSLLLALLPMLASADTVEIDGIWYYLVKKAKEAKVAPSPNYNYSGQLVIPASVIYDGTTYNVTSIGDNALQHCSGLTSIAIPNSVTSIGERAFEDCSGLTSITIPNSVTSIGERAFWGFTGLTSITIPNSVTSIGDCAFYFCSALTSITIPNSVTSIGDCAFYFCSALTSITIPNSVTSISDNVFEGCSSLTSVTIGNSVKSIGEYTFSGCSALASITIGNSVTNIGYEAFSGCTSLTSITIPNSVTGISNNVFEGCSSLTSVTIPNSMTYIGSQAFSGCDNLTDVYCLSEIVSSSMVEGFYTMADAFQGSYPQYITLHVPATSIEAYRTTEPWSKFKTIVALESGGTPSVEKCSTPTISLVDGEIVFNCETEGVNYISEVTSSDIQKFYDDKLKLTYKYNVTVYATKEGYENSDTATREILITENGKAILVGDVDGDGKVNAADHVKLSDIIMGK